MAFPKQRDIEIPLLKVLIAAGGRATPQEAIDRVTTYFPDLTPEDLTMKQPSGSDLKWQNLVAWVRNTLCEAEAIDRLAGSVACSPFACLGERRCFCSGVRPQRHFVSGGEKMLGHGIAHDAQSEKTSYAKGSLQEMKL